MINPPSWWAIPPERPRLRDDEVHVWLADLGRAESRIEGLRSLLSPDELKRAEGFYFYRDWKMYTVARGLLRTILASYTGVHPSDLKFAYSPHGKPFLSGVPSDCAVRFNVSHTYRLALYAVTYGRKVGVDVEYRRPHVAIADIAERYFSPREVETFRSLPEHQRGEAFYNCWTRKEAFIKAVGEGLSFPLDAFDVSLTPGEPAALLGIRHQGRQAAHWTLKGVRPAPGYVGAVAAEGQGWQLRRWLVPS